MEGKRDTPLTSAMTLTKLGASHVPSTYVLPLAQRANIGLSLTSGLPVIDLATLHDPLLRPSKIAEIERACEDFGFFQVINHGIPLPVIKGALDAASKFFDLSIEDKMTLWSDNVYEPVRYGTSINHAKDKVLYWRDFIKQYSHPVSKWTHLWPSNPPSYKAKMGIYAQAVRMLQKQLMEVVLESLGLKRNYMVDEIEDGSQTMAINCYPACPEPEIALGMPPHSDYGSLTILLQSCQGLQVMDHNKTWLPVPVVEGGLIVQLGDQLEVMSNGRYKSVVHQVTLSRDTQRLSIACLHSLDLHKKMGPAPMLVDEKHPAAYHEFSFEQFLNYITNNDFTTSRFIDSIKKKT